MKEMTAAILPAVASLGLAFSSTLTALITGALVLGSQVNEAAAEVEHYFTQLNAQLAVFSFQPPEESGDHKTSESNNETST